MIYLALPYTNPDKKLMDKRLELAMKYTAKYMKKGYVVYCGIAFLCPLAKKHKLPETWGYWSFYLSSILSLCSEIWVLKLPGWKESEGLQREIRLAQIHGLKIKYITPR